MPVKPTPYMLENPIYQQPQEQESERQESFEEIHWFLNRKERREKPEKKMKLQFEDEDMCNLQDSQSEVSLNKTLEFKNPRNLRGSA